MHNDDKLDQILDAALTNYVAEPPDGLEQRVISNVLADARDERTPWLRWSLGFGAVACLLVALFVFTHTTLRKSIVARVSTPPRVSLANPPQPVTQPSATQNTVAKHSVRRPTTHVTNHFEPLPKLAQFPTPRQLTEADKALLALVQQTKTEAITALTQLKDEPLSIKSIRIEEIRIEPMPSGSK